MKKLMISLIVTVVFGLASCATMEGLGEDISNAGKAIKKSASE